MAYINGKEILFSPHITITEGGNRYPFYTDDAVAYQKTVPDNALPYAALERVGGMSSVIDGTLHHAAVTGIESASANLFDPSRVTAYDKNGITITRDGDYIEIDGTVNYSSTNLLVYITNADIALEPNTNYTLQSFFESGEVTVSSDGYCIFYIDKANEAGTASNWLSVRLNENYSRTGSSGSDVKNRRMWFYISNGTVFKKARFRIAFLKGEPTTNFVPYMKRIFEIPEAVKALDGYGMGVNAQYYNYVDFAGRKYVQMCEQRARESGDEYIPDAITDGTNTIIYLPVPIVTDISSILPDDNVIAAHAGGTLTFCNADKIAVPSRIEYQTTEEG